MPSPECALTDDVLPCIAMYYYVHREPYVVFILITSVGSSEEQFSETFEKVICCFKKL
jgi:hypothetical protein